ncbi:hypothetical protein C3L33_20070, partial [Rhododendron williamsianum]
MALQLQVSLSTATCSNSSSSYRSPPSSWPTKQRSISDQVGFIGAKKRREKMGVRNVGMKRPVRCSLDTAGPVVTVGQVTEVCKDTFWPLVKAAGDKTVVVDMYTQWCGPCKDNKPLAKELGMKVVPTFKILKESKIVKEATGAKFDDLVIAIDSVRSS